MAQDNLITLKCSDCKNINYRSFKNKKQNPDKLSFRKHCTSCRKHTEHKETSKYMK